MLGQQPKHKANFVSVEQILGDQTCAKPNK